MAISQPQPFECQPEHVAARSPLPTGMTLAGWGTATPDNRIEQSDAARIAASLGGLTEKQQRLLPALYRQAGVRRRHSVLLESSTNGHPATQSFYQSGENAAAAGPSTADRMRVYEREAGRLALSASSAALNAAEVSPSQITHLVTVSCSGFSAPGFDIGLTGELGLQAQVARTHLGFMGCHGALNALRVAQAFTSADRSAHVLICAVELCSLHHQYGWNPEQIVANALFADGAGAMVCVGDGAQIETSSRPRLLASGSTIIPETTNLMGWRIRDHGFEMNLSARVPEVIATHLKPWLESWLAEYQLSLAEIGGWAIHPGGPRILQACADALGLDAADIDPSRQILAEYGNMSSPTILFILERIAAQPITEPCLLLAFGPGLTVEAAIVVPG